jgi:phytoene synthase
LTYNATVSPPPAELERAYATCASLARSHYENFPVASRLLPAPKRPHVAAVYAFARVADDMADEGSAAAAVRQAQLRQWQERLHQAVAAPLVNGSTSRDDLILRALAHTIRVLELPLSLFDDLLSAFGQDTTTTRYDSWEQLLDYCRRSANPVGRLVLRIAGYHEDDLDRSSDALCTALQLTNFWQDFGVDWRAGRLYVPRVVLDRCGAEEQHLRNGPLDDAWASALSACADVTRSRFQEGRLVCERVRGRLQFELRLTWVGGRHILDCVERDRHDLLRLRPVIRTADMPRLLWSAVRWDAATPARRNGA